RKTNQLLMISCPTIFCTCWFESRWAHQLPLLLFVSVFSSSMKALSSGLFTHLFLLMFFNTLSLVVRNSHPMLSDSSIRRLMRQRNVSQRCRNQNAGLTGPMRLARLALRERHRFPIGLSFLKHPEAGLREVTGHSHFRFAVATPSFNSFVEPPDMIVATTLAVEHCTVRRLHKGPFQIHIDIATHGSKTDLPTTGVLPCHQPTIARQLLGTTEALNSADLRPNHHRQDISHSRQRRKPGGLGTRSKDLHHLFFNQFQILTDVIQLIEHALKRLLGMGRQLGHKLRHDLTPLFTKGIARPFHRISVLAQSGVDPVLKLGSLAAEHHTRARQLASVTNQRRRDPNRRQGPCSLQPVHPFSIQLVALVHHAHHQFGQPRVDQLRLASSRLDLIDHPVPVPYCLHRHSRSHSPSVNEVLDRPMSVLQPTLVQSVSLPILDSCPGVLLMNVQCDVFHIALPPSPVSLPTDIAKYIAFILIRMTVLHFSRLRHSLLRERARVGVI